MWLCAAIPFTLPVLCVILSGDALSTPLVDSLCSVELICESGTSVYIRPSGFSTVTLLVPLRVKPFSQNVSARTPFG